MEYGYVLDEISQLDDTEYASFLWKASQRLDKLISRARKAYEADGLGKDEGILPEAEIYIEKNEPFILVPPAAKSFKALADKWVLSIIRNAIVTSGSAEELSLKLGKGYRFLCNDGYHTRTPRHVKTYRRFIEHDIPELLG